MLTNGLRRGVHVVVGFATLLVAARSLQVLGLVTPVVVQGSSMAPTLEGRRWRIECPSCRRSTDLGIDQQIAKPAAQCPLCAKRLDPDAVTLQPAERLWIDRSATDPTRWDRVVFRCPNDALSLCIKRVVGLPGETVTIAAGEVSINGRRVAKPLARQLEVRKLESLGASSLPGWQAADGGWRLRDDQWHGAAVGGQPARLVYPQPVHDDHPGNVAVHRRYNRLTDLMIEVSALHDPAAVLQLLLPGGHAMIDARRGVAVIGNHEQERQTKLPPAPHWQVVFSNFDGKLLLAVDGREQLILPVVEPTANPQPALRVLNASVTLRRLALYKDIYYEAVPLAVGAKGDQPWRLGADEYFVLGDNQAISVDSRRWRAGPGLPRRLILGRPHRYHGW